MSKLERFLFLFPFYFFSALSTTNTFNYYEGLNLFALMHLGLITRTQDSNFNKASSQKELFLNQHCCIVEIIILEYYSKKYSVFIILENIILEPHKHFFF